MVLIIFDWMMKLVNGCKGKLHDGLGKSNVTSATLVFLGDLGEIYTVYQNYNVFVFAPIWEVMGVI